MSVFVQSLKRLIFICHIRIQRKNLMNYFSKYNQQNLLTADSGNRTHTPFLATVFETVMFTCYIISAQIQGVGLEPLFLLPKQECYHYTTPCISGRRDLNPQQSDWKSEALPVELLPHNQHFTFYVL